MAITHRFKRGGADAGSSSTAGSTLAAEPVDPREPVDAPAPPTTGRRGRGALTPAELRTRLRDAWPLQLVRSAHPLQGVLTAVGLAGAAALSGRAGREVAVVLLTVLVGQAILGWHNDLVDRVRDARHQTPGKPIAAGAVEPGTVWFALACAVLLVVPLSIATGVTAGSCYLLSLAVGMLGNVALRRGMLSWLPWATAFALYPAYLSYGGWGGSAEGAPPTIAVTVLAALLGVAVHLLRATFGLVADNEDGWTYLPLRLGLKLGAAKLLAVAATYLVVVLVALAVVGASVGLRQ